MKHLLAATASRAAHPRAFGGELARLLIIVAFVGLANPAIALEIGGCELSPYGGISANASRVSEWSIYAEGDPQPLGITSVPTDDSATGARIFGGVDCGAHFAVEAGYADLGKVTARAQADGSGSLPPGTYDEQLELSGIDVTAIGRLPLSERWAIFGRAGILRSFTKVTGDISKDEETVNNPLFGAGLQYGPFGRWRVTAEYIDSMVATPPSADKNADRDGALGTVSLSVNYLL